MKKVLSLIIWILIYYYKGSSSASNLQLRGGGLVAGDERDSNKGERERQRQRERDRERDRVKGERICTK